MEKPLLGLDTLKVHKDDEIGIKKIFQVSCTKSIPLKSTKCFKGTLFVHEIGAFLRTTILMSLMSLWTLRVKSNQQIKIS